MLYSLAVNHAFLSWPKKLKPSLKNAVNNSKHLFKFALVSYGFEITLLRLWTTNFSRLSTKKKTTSFTLDIKNDTVQIHHECRKTKTSLSLINGKLGSKYISDLTCKDKEGRCYDSSRKQTKGNSNNFFLSLKPNVIKATFYSSVVM